MSLGLRPKARRAAGGAVITGKLANGPSGSGGKPLRGAGYVERQSLDAFPLCLAFPLQSLENGDEPSANAVDDP